MSGAEGWRKAPAKVNLRLSVLGRRDDGFHELDGVMALVELADSLACEELDASAGGDRLERVRAGGDRLERTSTVVRGAGAGDGSSSPEAWLDRFEVPLGADNLVLRAADAYRQAAQQRDVLVPPLRWRLVKRIPIAAGLGGGSSDAAAALGHLESSYPAGIDLLALAERLGSDVPFFVLGAAAARARGRGERLEPVGVPAQPLVLVNPGVGVSAADAFRWWDPGRPAKVPFDVPSWWAGPPVANDLEAGVAERVGEVRRLLDVLRANHDGPVAMSGSGATCFALAPDPGSAVELAHVLRRQLGPDTWIEVSALAARAEPRGPLAPR